MEKVSNFDAWYSFYPNKKAKGDARKAYEKAEKENGDDKQEFLAMLMAAVQAQIKFRRQQQGTGVFVPNWRLPATWIRSESWCDEIQLADEKKSQLSLKKCIKCDDPVHGDKYSLCSFHVAMGNGTNLINELRDKGRELGVGKKSVPELRLLFKKLAKENKMVATNR